MAKKLLWAGIDCGVETASLCVIDDAGEIVHQGVCACSPAHVSEQLGQFRRTRLQSVALESGTGTHVARGLRSLGFPVELYEARQLSKFLRIRRNKTDAGDAKGIAEAGRISASLVSRVYLKSLESQALQSRLAIRRHLIHQRIAAANLLGRQIELYGGRLRCSATNSHFRAAVEEQIAGLFPKRPDKLVTELRFLTNHVERLVVHQRAIDRALERAASENQVCRRLMGIPGVGPLCALSFYASVDDPYRFAKASQIGSYFGLAPRVYQSGLSARNGRITKMGNKNVRSLLVNAAIGFLHYGPADSALREWTVRIEQRRGRAPSRVALARKLAVIMIALWKSGEGFNLSSSSSAPAHE